MLTTYAAIASVRKTGFKASLPIIQFKNYNSTNQYTDSSGNVYTNYVYLTTGSSKQAVVCNGFTGTIHALIVGGGAPGTTGTGNPCSGGSAGAMVCAHYALTNSSDTITSYVANSTVELTNVQGPNGDNSSLTFSSTTTLNTVAQGAGGSGVNNAGAQNGASHGNGCGGAAGRYSAAVGGVTLATGYTFAQEFSTNGINSDNANCGMAGSGAAAAGSNTGAATPLRGGAGRQVPAGYGISTYYYYCGGGGGYCNVNTYSNTANALKGGIGGGGGGCDGSSSSNTYLGGGQTGFGARDDAGTGGTTSSGSNGNGAKSGGNAAPNSGSGGGAGLTTTAGTGASGIIILSILTSSLP